MKRYCLVIVALLGTLLMVACGGEKKSLAGYWEGFEPSSVYDNVDGAEAHFQEWVALLAEADTTAQKSAIEEFVTKVCSDEVCFYIYTEWAMGHLYGLWSPVRNEFAFGHLLRTLMANVEVVQDNDREFQRLLDIVGHNRVGEPVEDLRLSDVEGKESRLSDYRGERVLLLLADITCPTCMDIFTTIEAHKGIMESALRGEVTFVTVAVGQIPESIGEFAARHKGSAWNVHCALRSDLEGAYFDTNASPALFLIDREGRVEVAMTRDVEEIAEAIL